MPGLTPRRTVETSWAGKLWTSITDLGTRVSALERGATLRNAAISGGDGLKVYGPDGALRISLNTTDGAVVAYDETEQAVARFGPLDQSAPGSFGVEILVEGDWIRLGYQTTGWAQIGGKPGWAANSSSIAGSYISGDVASALSAAAAAQADGSAYAFNNNVGGTQFYAVWVGNDGGFHFGRNTSSIRYKENVRDADTQEGILQLRPVVYDRKARLKYPTDEDGAQLIGPPQLIEGAKNEFGLIAEETAEHLPEVVTTYEGEIDGIRYDLLAVAAIPVLQRHDSEIAALKSENDALKAQLAALTEAVRTLGGNV